MSIGLHDVDITLYNTVPVNLELCKYSAYYKNRREIVTMSPSFTPNKFTTFIVRKDYQDGNFPNKIEKYDNIIYGGHAFSGSQYIPLDESIESQIPDLSIYEKYKFTFGSTNKLLAAFDSMLRASHLRLSLDGKNIWDNYEKQLNLLPTTRTLFFHDYDLNKIEGGREEIEKLFEKIEKGTAYGFLATKYPIVVSNLEDLIYWCNFKSTGSFFNMEYRGPMPDEELYDFLKMHDLKTNPTKIDYIVTANYKDQDDFLIRGLSQIYNQILFLRMSRTKILLKYENNFFVDKRWERLINLFNCFLNSTLRLDLNHFNRVIDFDSMYSFVRSFDDSIRYDKFEMFNKQEARELFTLVRETNYDVFKYFYEAHKVELIGGQFKNDAE